MRFTVNRQHFRLRSFCIIMFNCSVFWGGRRRVFPDPICCSFLTWFGHDFPAGQFVSVRSFLIAATIRYFGLFLLSLVTRFVTLAKLAKIWFWVSSEVITIFIWGHHHLRTWRPRTTWKDFELFAFAVSFGFYIFIVVYCLFELVILYLPVLA